MLGILNTFQESGISFTRPQGHP